MDGIEPGEVLLLEIMEDEDGDDCCVPIEDRPSWTGSGRSSSVCTTKMTTRRRGRRGRQAYPQWLLRKGDRVKQRTCFNGRVCAGGEANCGTASRAPVPAGRLCSPCGRILNWPKSGFILRWEKALRGGRPARFFGSLSVHFSGGHVLPVLRACGCSEWVYFPVLCVFRSTESVCSSVCAAGVAILYLGQLSFTGTKAGILRFCGLICLHMVPGKTVGEGREECFMFSLPGAL